MADISARAQIKRWVREEIQGRDEVRISELVVDAMNLFNSPEFQHQLFVEALREMVYNLASDVIKETRGLIPTIGGATSKQAIRRKASQHIIFSQWMEHVGDRHIRLLEMTREDLVVAAAERRQRGEYELGLATLWEQLAEDLEPGQKVSTKWSVDDIQRIKDGMRIAIPIEV